MPWAPRIGREAPLRAFGGFPGYLAGRVPWVFQLGLCLYALNLCVGLAARFGGTRFGVWHHVLYALVAASTLAATVLDFRPGLLLTVLALAVIPRLSARSNGHPALALLGLAGYLLALL